MTGQDPVVNPAFSSLREQTAGLASFALEQDLLGQNDVSPMPPRRGSIITSDSARPHGESSPSRFLHGSSFGSSNTEEWPVTNAPIYPHRGGSTIHESFKQKAAGFFDGSPGLYNASNHLTQTSDPNDQQNANDQSPLIREAGAHSPSSGFAEFMDSSNTGNGLSPYTSRLSRQPNLSPHLEYHTFKNPSEEPNHYFTSFRPVSWSKRARQWAAGTVSGENFLDQCVKRPLGYIPSVILGVLLNILDGLSYGMILFPLTQPIFAGLGPAGLSMFYVSCVISQLVYSLGASAFQSGVGSEMIEVVPFFHSMAATIIMQVGEDNPKAVVATTILAYALSSIVTGLVFFMLGYAKLGSLAGFFPRHILVGCIGGVGWFLMVTGFEVSSRINGDLEYNWETLKFLIEGATLLKWGIPLALALLLVFAQKYTHHPLLVPSYFIVVFALFHVVVALVPSLTLQDARDAGWLFQGPTTSEPWWSFYKLYDFTAVDYMALFRTIPAMFALTFFGILHVPINVPALAASIGEDNIDVDRELIAHGISNALSGLMGSIQNYLVYTNSVLFIKSGADSRLSGVMLAVATFGVMLAGPDVIGFIPVMVVGALIFLLGIELLMEALLDTYGRVSRFEYFTIVAIVVTMGAVEFVTGIIVGIVLACVSFVIQASQRSAIKATYTGTVARSTVRRNAAQQRFLGEVGNQIFVLKLSGSIFFGTIVRIEKSVRDLLDDVYFKQKPIRYLVLDISNVTEIDFSAAEAFARIKRLLDAKNVFMLIAGATNDGGMTEALHAVGLLKRSYVTAGSSNAGFADIESQQFQDEDDDPLQVRLFPNLNSALEWSENEFLKDYYKKRDLIKSIYLDQQKQQRQQRRQMIQQTPSKSSSAELDIPHGAFVSNGDHPVGSPRVAFLQQIVDKTVLEDPQVNTSKWQHFKQPLPLLIQTFQGLSNKCETFWFHASDYFVKEEIKAGTVLYSSESEPSGFYIVESGILRADYELEQGEIYETVLAGTTCGELPFFSETTRTATVTAEVDTIVWKLDRQAWENLRKNPDIGQEMAQEFYKIALKLTVERFTSVMAYILISSTR